MFKCDFKKGAEFCAKAIGTPISIGVHTVLIIGVMSLGIFGVEWNRVLLILTTALSIEAIYLALFNQLITNKVMDKDEN